MTEREPASVDIDATADVSDSGPSAAADPAVTTFATEVVLGRGGNCEVVLGRQSTLDRNVALKRLLPSRKNAAGRERLLGEARLLGKLEHPNIVPLHGLVYDHEGWPSLMLKRVTGLTWADALANRGRGEQRHHPEKDLRVLIDVCHAVAFAHDHEVLHLDIKPSNVMLDAHGQTYLADWGSALALPIGASGVALPPGSSVRGTPRYIAPELALAPVGTWVDGRADVYSLGLVAREILVLESEGASETDKALAFDREARELVNRATAADPDERFQSVDAFREALEVYLGHDNARALGRDAKVQLERLRVLADLPEASAVELQELFIQCRFACDRSLRAYGDQPEVRALQDEAHRVMIRRAICRGDLESAQVLLASLFEPDQAIAQAISELREARERSAQTARTALERLRAEDVSLGVNERRKFGFVVAHLALVASLGLWFVFGSPPTLAYLEVLAFDAGYLLSMLALAPVIARRYARNRATQRLFLSVALMRVLALVVGLTAMEMEFSVAHAVALRLLILAVATSYVALLFVSRRIWMTSAVEGLSLLAALALPDHVGVVWVVNNWLAYFFTSLLPSTPSDRVE